MTNHARHKKVIEDRLAQLGVRMNRIEDRLDTPTTKDVEDRAIEIEDFEVLEGVGNASLEEVRLLQNALFRIEDGTYGECLECGEQISDARLDAVPYAALCRNCAAQTT